MRKFIFSLALIAVLLLPVADGATYSEEIKTNALEAGDDAVDFTLQNFHDENETFSLDRYDGKLLLVDLMAAWCGPCRASMPDLVKLYNKYIGSGIFDVISVGIDENEPRADLEAFHAGFGITWDFAQDHLGAIGDGYFGDTYGTGFVPSYYLIWNGKITFADIGWQGFDFYEDKVTEYITETDGEAPQLHDASEPADLAENPSIVNSELSLFADVTDNWNLQYVKAIVTLNSITTEYRMELNDSGIFEVDIKLDTAGLYYSTSFTLKYTAMDYWDNVYNSEDYTYSVDFAEDTVDPEIDRIKYTHSVDEEKNSLQITFTSWDNVGVKKATLKVDYGNGTTDDLEIENTFGTSFKIVVDYRVSQDITGYTYSILIEDVAGNILTEDLELTLKTPVVTEENTNEGLSFNFSFLPLAIVAIPVIRKKFKK